MIFRIWDAESDIDFYVDSTIEEIESVIEQANSTAPYANYYHVDEIELTSLNYLRNCLIDDE